MTFEIVEKTTFKLSNAKGRKEFHGETKVLALDLSVNYKGDCKILDLIDPRLRQLFFSNIPPELELKQQGNLGLPVNEESPFVRFDHMVYPIKLDLELAGHTLRLDYGRGERADKVLNLCKLKKFEFTPIQDGVVELDFSISSAADITGAMVGLFSERIQQEIVITLLAANDVQGNLIDASSSGDAPGAAGAAAEPAPPTDATGEFLARNMAPEGGDGSPATH